MVLPQFYYHRSVPSKDLISPSFHFCHVLGVWWLGFRFYMLWLEAYDALDPNGNITVKWDVMSWTGDGYVVRTPGHPVAMSWLDCWLPSIEFRVTQHRPRSRSSTSTSTGTSKPQGGPWAGHGLRRRWYGAWPVARPRSKAIAPSTRAWSLIAARRTRPLWTCCPRLSITSRLPTAAREESSARGLRTRPTP